MARHEETAEEAQRRRNTTGVWVFLALVGVVALIGFLALADGQHPPYRGPAECGVSSVPGPLVCTPSLAG